MNMTENFNFMSNWLLVMAVLFCNSLIWEGIVRADQDAISSTDKDSKSVTAEGSYHQGSELKFPPYFFTNLPWDWFDQENGANLNHGLDSMAECHFTMSIFVEPVNLPLCEKLGLMTLVATFGSDESIRKNALTDAAIEEKVRQLVEKSGNSKAVLGYHIMDEPGASCFPTLGKIVQAFRKYAPGKLAFINLYPNYATIGAKDNSQLEAGSYTEYLEKFVHEVKPHLLSYDNYMVEYSNDLANTEMAASYYENLLEVRRVAIKYNLPFWNIVSSNQIRPDAAIPSPANLSFQAYTTLAAGGKGIGWWTYYSRGPKRYAPVDKFDPNENAFVKNSDKKTLTWHYLQEVNRQIAILGPLMLRLTPTGVYFTSPAPAASCSVLPGKLVKEVKSNTPMMIGEFKSNDGIDYAMIVNLSLQKTTGVFIKTIKSYEKIELISAQDGTLWPMDNKEGVWLVAGQGVLIRLSGEKL